MIVAAKFRDTIRWYESDVDYWILDQRSWAEAFVAAGHGGDLDDFADRFDMAIVDAENAEAFLSRMEMFQISRDALRARLERTAASSSDWFELAQDLPSLFVDFDGRAVWSMDSEQTSVIDHAPQGWVAEYSNVFDRLPVESRYWSCGDRNLLSPYI